MNKKYKHPWLLYPYTWLLILLSILFLFTDRGWIAIIVLWFYKCAYHVIAPISWAKQKEKYLEITEQEIHNGKPYVFPDKTVVTNDYGIEKGNELLLKASKNVRNTYDSKERELKAFKTRIIKDTIVNDCETWHKAWERLTIIPWVKKKTYKDAEQLFNCTSPSSMLPFDWERKIAELGNAPLSSWEIEILNNTSYANEEKGGLDIDKLPVELIESYKTLSFRMMRYDMTQKEKKEKMNQLKRFSETGDISILELREEDLV